MIIYFWTEIVVLVRAWFRGLFNAERRTDPDYRLAWLVIIGSLPIVVVGFLARDIVSGPLRSLWVVAFALIVWGGVMLLAEAVAKQDRGERDLNLADCADHRVRPVPGADPWRVPVRRDHLGRPDARPGPGDGDPARRSCSASRRCWAPACTNCRRR